MLAFLQNVTITSFHAQYVYSFVVAEREVSSSA
jgi:hypothetical protein